MIMLSRRERRLLHHIERGLLDEDPGFARMLGGSGIASVKSLMPRLVYLWVAAGMLLIFGGLALSDNDMVLGGVIVQGALPVVVALVVLINKTAPR